MLEQGTILAGYRIDGVLGEGGMAVVYRATQMSLNRVVALKLLASALGEDPGFRERFKREGQIQAGLDHQHIVAVYEAGESELGLFLAMRLVPGPTLKELILRGELDPRRTARLLAQVAQALDTAHEAGLIHRDIKPQNILVDKGDHVYLADFGLTKAIDDETSLTHTGQFLGTIDYSAPEQIQGEAPTAATDIYALTAVLYECLTGQVPFRETNEAAVLHAHIMKPPPRPTEVRPELPAGIDDVIARGMAKDPSARPSSASELLREATAILASVSLPAGAPQTRASAIPEMRTGGQPTRVPGSGPAAPSTPAGPAGPTRQADVAAVTRAADSASPVARSGAGRPLALALVLGVLAAVVGFLVGDSGGKPGAAKLSNTASAGHLQLRYPSSWKLGSQPPALPGLTFSEPIALTTGAQQGLVAGEVAAGAGATLLPPSLRSAVEGSLPRAQPVRFGGVEGYRYDGLRVHGFDGSQTVFAVATDAGVATLDCWSSAAARGSFAGECARLVASLRLVGSKPYPLGADAAYGTSLSSVLERMHSDTAGELGTLSHASTQAGQASAADRVGSGFAKAAGALKNLTVPPAAAEANAAIAAAAAKLGDAYSSLASAARAGDSGAYGTASRDAKAASSALSDALRALGSLGYTVES